MRVSSEKQRDLDGKEYASVMTKQEIERSPLALQLNFEDSRYEPRASSEE